LIRRARADDVPALAAALARAFHDDPVTGWFWPPGPRQLDWFERFFAFRLRSVLSHDEIWTTDDLAGAAVWAEPGRWKLGPLDNLRLVRFAPSIGRRIPAVLRGMQAVEHAHPTEPHWYLAVLGTEPSRQGEGIGSALLEPVLADCDENDVPAYLESSKESNIAFYSRHGFRVTEGLRLPDGGPPLWPMWREARP
jgi:ribosomal protein S18 acetylase RimI-like enzyme